MEAPRSHSHRWYPLHTFIIHNKLKLFFRPSVGLLYPFLSLFWCIRQSFTSQLNGFGYNASRTKYGALDHCRIAWGLIEPFTSWIVYLLRLGMARNVRCARIFLRPLSTRS